MSIADSSATGTMTVETNQMKRTVRGFIKNVHRKWSSTGRLATWPAGELLQSGWVDDKAQC